MSKYFIFNETTPELHSNEDIAKIREYLELVGELNCSDKQLYVLWADFSDSWDAVWLEPNGDTLKPFAEWLADYKDD